MAKKLIFGIFVFVAITAAGIAIFSFAVPSEEVARGDAIRIIADAVCLKIDPPLQAFPEEQRYVVLANGLASKGIMNFLNTDPVAMMTIGDMQEVFNAVTAGQMLEYEPEREWCSVELPAIFAKGADQTIAFSDFRKVVDCLPACDFDTAETYIAPTPPGYVPPGPDSTPEEPATEI